MTTPIENTIHRAAKKGYNWTYVNAMIGNRFEIIKTGSNCGRCIIAYAADEFYLIRDAAHNLYTIETIAEGDLIATIDLIN